MDGAGNVYATGFSDTDPDPNKTNFDYIKIKYDRDGCFSPTWPDLGDGVGVRRFNGVGNGDDQAFALVVDASGNVYVTGLSDRDPDPNLVNYDYVTIVYSANGNFVWSPDPVTGEPGVRRYNGPGNGNDEAAAIALDASSNVYVTGKSLGSGTNGLDYATVKYRVADGFQFWVRRYDGPGNGEDRANAITVDNQNYIIVTGTSTGSGTNGLDYATIQYHSNGDRQWTRRYHSADLDEAKALTVDPDRNLYVTGAFRSLSGASVGTLSYDPNGTLRWVHSYAGGSQAGGNAITLDNQLVGGQLVTRYVYSAGFVTAYPTGSLAPATLQYVTIQYNPTTGNANWVSLYGGVGNDTAYAVGVDPAGNVYVTGESRPNSYTLPFDYATVKYNQLGNQCWDRRYDGTGGGDDSAYALAVDGDGNVYITGRSWGYDAVRSVSTHFDYATVKYCLVLGDVTSPNYGANRDGVVDSWDYDLVYDCRGSPCTCCREDVNGDGIVDATDVSIVQSNLGKACLADALRRR